MIQFTHGFALLVGIADYQYVNTLPPAVLHDVQALSDQLTDAQACGYPKNQVKTLLNQAATADGIRAGLQWLADETSEEDTAVIYFSGHGGRVNVNGQVKNYLIPYDATVNRLPETAIGSEELSIMLRRIQAGRLVALFDCCHAGGIGTPKSLSPATTYKTGLQEHVFDQLGKGSGRVIIASSKSDELSWIYAGMANSLFTTYLVEGLRGGVSNEQYQVLIMDLFNYVASRVTAAEPNQHPILKAELENNFPIALAFPKAIPIEGETEGLIPLEARPIFYQLFRGYQKIVVKKSFSRGWSGAILFDIRPFKKNEDDPELNNVIKLGPAPLIQQEWDAYLENVQNKLPKIANIMGNPIFDPGHKWGVLRYPLVGSGIFDVKSLGEHFLALPTATIEKTVQAWLFPPLETLWQQHKLQYEYSLRKGFAFWLPANLDKECSQLKQRAQDALGGEINLDAETLEFATGTNLPNPIVYLPHLLDQKVDVCVGPIHGDLNLENILLVRSVDQYNVELIDAARARKDYVLHDIFCLETGVLVNVLPKLLAQHPTPLSLLNQLLICLHLVQTDQDDCLLLPNNLETPFKFLLICRRKAIRYLSPQRKWEEYYQGLIIYLLGTLDFDSLNVEAGERPLPKQIAFWGAAIALWLLDAKPSRSELVNTIGSHPKRENPGQSKPIMLRSEGIPPELYKELRTVLADCGPVMSQRELHHTLSHPLLIPFRNRMPNANSLDGRLAAMIAYLQGKHRADTGENALVLFLKVLNEQFDPNDECHTRLSSLIERLETAQENKEKGHDKR